MLATITAIEWKPSEKTGIPYAVVKATAVQGDVNAPIFDEEDEDVINPMACMSRTFNLTKCLFPGTVELAALQQAGYTAGKKLRLGLFVIPIGKKFHIYGADGELLCDKRIVKVKAEKAEIVNGKIINIGEEYEKEVLTPRVFESISLVLFTNKAGESIENEGEKPEAIAARNFAASIEKGSYVLISE